jgi:hypothetical protein
MKNILFVFAIFISVIASSLAYTPSGPQPASCDCYGWSVYQCGPHSIVATDCRNQIVTQCSTRCPAADSSNCAAWAVTRCTNTPTFIGTGCRTIVTAQCTARPRAAPVAQPIARPAPVAQPAPVAGNYVPSGPQPVSCDCYGWSVYKCGPHSITATDCRNQIVTECSIRCPAEDFSNCNAWAVTRCTNTPTFIGTGCRTIVAAQCTARAQGLKPTYVPNSCDCYGQSLYQCGPHSVTNLDCRTKLGDQCVGQCPPTPADCQNCNTQDALMSSPMLEEPAELKSSRDARQDALLLLTQSLLLS